MSTLDTTTEAPADIRPEARSAIRSRPPDHPQNSALILIDYQPSQVQACARWIRTFSWRTSSRRSSWRRSSTYRSCTPRSMWLGSSGPDGPSLAELLEDYPPIDRTSLNAWEDADFLSAVRATGRRKLIACALWTESAWPFPRWTPSARATSLSGGGRDRGTSPESHRAGLERVTQAGGAPISWSRWRASFSAIGRARNRRRRRRDRPHRATAEARRSLVSAEQRENLDAILRQSAFPPPAMSTSNGGAPRVVSAQPLPAD